TDMWLSGAEPLGAWIQYEFDKVYKLHQMQVWNSNQAVEPMLGFGLRDVTVEYSTNGTDYMTLGTTHEFARAPGAGGYAHNTTIDFDGAAAKYVRLTATSNWGGVMPQYGLSEVRILYIPVLAREPDPNSGATDVSIGTIDEPIDVTLSWRAGREAVTHDVYFGADEQAVADGTVSVISVTEPSYGPLSLDLGKTYYWRVDEANDAETPAMWQGDLWNFSAQEYFAVDDFESYNDLDTTDPDSNRIFNVWIDGYEVPTNGCLVGYDQPPFTEQSNVHSGKQAMPFFFSNTGGAANSEAELTLSPAQNWTVAGAATLVLYFHGTEGNTGQLYVKVNGSKVVYGGDAGDIAKPEWNQWSIDLASLSVNLQNVTKLAIGVDGNGASGTLLFDDIRLY
ncbi:MAG: discoidin domain-containing protein, partial [Planctomycetota bacterium]